MVTRKKGLSKKNNKSDSTNLSRGLDMRVLIKCDENILKINDDQTLS